MTYITTTAKKNFKAAESNLVIAEVIDAAKEISPEPIMEIQVGTEMYENLNNYAEIIVPVKKQPQLRKRYLSNLYGVKLVIDPSLKPNEYKFVYKTEKSDKSL